MISINGYKDSNVELDKAPNRDREPLKRPPPTAPYVRVRIRRLACYLQRRFIGQIEFTSSVYRAVAGWWILHHSVRTEMSPIRSKCALLNPLLVANVLESRQ